MTCRSLLVKSLENDETFICMAENNDDNDNDGDGDEDDDVFTKVS